MNQGFQLLLIMRPLKKLGAGSVVLKVIKSDSNQRNTQERDEAKAQHNWDSFYRLSKFLGSVI